MIFQYNMIEGYVVAVMGFIQVMTYCCLGAIIDVSVSTVIC